MSTSKEVSSHKKLIGCVTILSVVIALCCGGAALVPQAFEDLFEYAFDRQPVYDGMSLHVDSGEVLRVYLHPQATPNPQAFFILIDDSPVHVRDITGTDLIKAGFNAESSTIYATSGSTLHFDMATFESQKLKSLVIVTTRVKFSASKEGPFISVPVSMSEFKKQFGDPREYRRGGGGRRYSH